MAKQKNKKGNAKKTASKKTVSKKASSKNSLKNKLATVLRREERDVYRKFHDFLDAWKTHVEEELAMHKKLSSKSDLKKHVADTLKIHEKFLKKIDQL